MTISDSDSVFSRDLFDSDFEFDYYNTDEQRTLRELDASDTLFVNFPSLSDFYDIYTCDVSTDTHLCSVCTEIKVAL